METKEIYRNALVLFGAEAQICMAFEEMAELQKELCKRLRGKDNIAAIAEEIADVQIMLEQMILLHACADEIARMKEFKVARLEERVSKKLERMEERKDEL